MARLRSRLLYNMLDEHAAAGQQHQRRPANSAIALRQKLLTFQPLVPSRPIDTCPFAVFFRRRQLSNEPCLR